jgi:hypothetical protein
MLVKQLLCTVLITGPITIGAIPIKKVQPEALNEQAVCTAPTGWCIGDIGDTGRTTTDFDCDGDGINDRFCSMGPVEDGHELSGYLSSAHGCTLVWPGDCPAATEPPEDENVQKMTKSQVDKYLAHASSLLAVGEPAAKTVKPAVKHNISLMGENSFRGVPLNQMRNGNPGAQAHWFPDYAYDRLHNVHALAHASGKVHHVNQLLAVHTNTSSAHAKGRAPPTSLTDAGAEKACANVMFFGKAGYEDPLSKPGDLKTSVSGVKSLMVPPGCLVTNGQTSKTYMSGAPNWLEGKDETLPPKCEEGECTHWETAWTYDYKRGTQKTGTHTHVGFMSIYSCAGHVQSMFPEATGASTYPSYFGVWQHCYAVFDATEVANPSYDAHGWGLKSYYTNTVMFKCKTWCVPEKGLTFTGITYSSYSVKTKGVFLFNKGDHWSDEMKEAASMYDYYGGRMVTEDQPRIDTAEMFYVFGGSLARVYPAPKYRGTASSNTGLTHRRGFGRLPNELNYNPSIESRTHLESRDGTCLTASDNGAIRMMACRDGATTQFWWKEYYSGGNGNFHLMVESPSRNGEVVCLRAADAGYYGGNGGFYHSVTDADRRRTLVWGVCDATDKNSQWVVAMSGTGGGSPFEQLASAQKIVGPNGEEQMFLLFACGDVQVSTGATADDGTSITESLDNHGVCLENDWRGNNNMFTSNMDWHRQYFPSGVTGRSAPSMRILDMDSPRAQFGVGSWQLAGSVQKIDAGPAWPVVGYGVSSLHASTEEAGHTVGSSASHESSYSSFSSFKHEAGGEASASVGGKWGPFGAEASASVHGGYSSESTHSSTHGHGAESSRESTVALAKETAMEKEHDLTCPLQCTIPSTVHSPGTGKGPKTEMNDGVGTAYNCPDDSDGEPLMYIWRWQEDLVTADGASAKIQTCHTRCTCTRQPPRVSLLQEGEDHTIASKTPGLPSDCRVGDSIQTAFDASTYKNACHQHCTGAVTIAGVPYDVGTATSHKITVHVDDQIEIPLGCALRMYNDDNEKTHDDYLQSFTYAAGGSCPRYGNAQREVYIAVSGYDPVHDNRVLVMDSHSKTGGDQQNVCRGALLAPGMFSTFTHYNGDDRFDFPVSLKVLGGARMTVFGEENYMGRQMTVGPGVYHGIPSGLSVHIHGEGKMWRTRKVETSWSLVGSLARDNTDPEWPMLVYGATFETGTSQEEAREQMDATESSFEEASTHKSDVYSGYGGSASVEAVVKVEASFEVTNTHGAGSEAATTSTRGSSVTTARAFASTLASSQSATTECVYACPIPSGLTSGVQSGGSIEVNSGIGSECPNNEPGNQVYMWRWTGKVTSLDNSEDGDGHSMSIDTCHTQCTCTPNPPPCDFSECADVWCTRCKTD